MKHLKTFLLVFGFMSVFAAYAVFEPTHSRHPVVSMFGIAAWMSASMTCFSVLIKIPNA